MRLTTWVEDRLDGTKPLTVRAPASAIPEHLGLRLIEERLWRPCRKAFQRTGGDIVTTDTSFRRIARSADDLAVALNAAADGVLPAISQIRYRPPMPPRCLSRAPRRR